MKRNNSKYVLLGVNSFSLLTLLFFSSMEVYMGNYNEFKFPFSRTWWVVLLFAFATIAIITGIMCILPERIKQFLCAGSFSLGLCCYVQSIFLNGEMQSFTGDTIIFNRNTIIFNALMWLLIIMVVLVSYCQASKHSQLQLFNRVILFCSLGLIFIQSVAFISNIVTLPKSDVLKQGYFSSDGEFELSKNNNVVWFIIDSCDGSIVEEERKKNPEVFDGFNDFKYYPNSVPTYSRTYPSIVYLLTHEMCYMDKPYEEYVNDAWKNSIFIPQLHDNGVDVRLYTDPRYLGLSATEYVNNYRNYLTVNPINISKLINQMIHVSAYRDFPYLLKSRFAYNIDILNCLVLKYPEDSAIQYDDYLFYSKLSSNGLTINSNYDSALRFYHLCGTHSGNRLDAQCNLKENPTTEESLLASLKIIRTYLEKMRRIGTYNNSTVIITADHGYTLASESLKLERPTTCIMMVKLPDNDQNSITISNSPVSHENIFNTVNEALNIQYSDGFDISFFDVPDENKVRKHYYTALKNDIEGEIALREYHIQGDARDLSNWQLTGNDWDIEYSERTVSKERLSNK